MSRTLIFLSLIIASGILLTNIYTSIVDATAWGSRIPDSILAAREYYKGSNPGNFFRIFSPLNQLLALLCVIFCWRSGRPVRVMLILAFVLYVLAESLTFMFFYPRNDIMFMSDTMDVELLRSTWSEWNSMNWVRSLIVAAGVACTSMALHRWYIIRA